MPKQVKKVVEGREYFITEKVAAITEKWRARLRESNVYTIFLSLDAVIEQAVNAFEDGIENLQPGTVIAVARTLPATVVAMVGSMDEIKALVFDYVPEMRADREWLDERVMDSWYTEVFVEVLKLNFPILGALELIRGLRAPGTATNLPQVNGAGGTKKSSARSKIR